MTTTETADHKIGATGLSRRNRGLMIALGVGFLGAFTTFSTFSVETQSMLRDGRGAAAALYVGASLVGGVGLAAAGYALAAARGA